MQKAGKTVKVLKLPLPKINISSLKVIFEDHRTYASTTAVSVILPLVFGYGNFLKTSFSVCLFISLLPFPCNSIWTLMLFLAQTEHNEKFTAKDSLVDWYTPIIFVSFEKTRVPLRLVEVQDVIDDSCSLCSCLFYLADWYILKYCRLMFEKVYGGR